MSPGHIEPPADCNGFARELLSRVGDKWSIAVVGNLSNGPMRFNALKRAIGVSQRMLTLTLRSLGKDGLVTRTAYPTIPPRVDYALTPLGWTLLEPVTQLVVWANTHQGEVERARLMFEGIEETSGNT